MSPEEQVEEPYHVWVFQHYYVTEAGAVFATGAGAGGALRLGSPAPGQRRHRPSGLAAQCPADPGPRSAGSPAPAGEHQRRPAG